MTVDRDFYLWAGFELGKGSEKRKFLRGGSIEIAGFQSAGLYAIGRAVKLPPPNQQKQYASY